MWWLSLLNCGAFCNCWDGQRHYNIYIRCDVLLAHPSPQISQLINRGVALGYLQVNGGKLQEAIETFKAILKDDKECAIAYLGLGSAKAMQGDYSGAESDFGLAVKYKPEMADAHKRRGQTLSAMGKQVEAVKSILRAIECDAKSAHEPDPDCFNQLGNLYYKLMRFRQALNGFLKCLGLLGNPKKDADGLISARVGGGGVAGLYNMVGLCYSSIGNYDMAKGAFELAIEIDESKEYHLNLGQLYRDYGRGTAALTCYQKAIALDKTYTSAFYLAGLCFYGMGRLSECVQSLMGALRSIQAGGEEDHQQKTTTGICKSSANVPAIFHMLLVSHVGLGDYKTALKMFQVGRRRSLILIDSPVDFGGGIQPFGPATSFFIFLILFFFFYFG